MAEEFEESEVIFQENVDQEDSDEECSSHQLISRNNKAAAKRKKLKPNYNKNSAAPVSIPENVCLRYIDQSDFAGGGDDDDGGEMVPPHIIVGRRRVAGKMMAFSVCTGNGRTLKGRDLSRVRNSVLRMTGFLET